jgi:outer membrane protein OmpA-like peptidoglycan-associated protein
MRIKILIIGMLICTAGISQDFTIKRKLADSYYNQYDFYRAIPLYDQMLKSNPEDSLVYEKLAQAYDHLNDSENAERCYAFLAGRKAPKPEYLLGYARTLSRNGKYGQAIVWYGKYSQAKPEDPRGAAFGDAYKNIRSFYQDSSSCLIKKAPFSTAADDFSPSYFGESVVFSSDRSEFSLLHSTYNWTHTPYLDLYIAGRDSSGAKPFSGELNSKYHEGPVTFSRGQDTIIFTRSNYYHSRLHKSGEGINKLSLFRAVWDGSQKKWTDITPLSMNSDEYSVEHPALSPDGSRLYFASDMPGGQGGFDLYVCRRIAGSDGKAAWDKPVNLGPGINSRGNEMFPFVDRDGNLWYASNGIPGLGGLDIFRAEKRPEGFAEPVNAGYPLNTRFDDFGFITSGTGEEGYFSSDRNNNYGNDDIYSFSKYYRKPILVFDRQTGLVLPESRINVEEQGAAPGKIADIPAAAAVYGFKPYKSYDLSAKAGGYKLGRISMTKDQIRQADTIMIALQRDAPLLSLKGLVFSAGSRAPLAGYTAVITGGTGVAQEFRSDTQGFFTGDLQAGTGYRITVTGSEGKNKCIALPVELTTAGIAKDSTLNVLFPVYCEGDLIAMEDIYYDLDKYNIREDAAKVLDKLYKLMNDYPQMKIELRSHTDSRASAGYNMALSDNRAKSAAEYLFSKGISRNRVMGKGYGETMLLNKCSDGVPCSEAEHQRNRRTEFKILSLF